MSVCCLAAALGLLLMPEETTEGLRHQARDMARPGLLLTALARSGVQNCSATALQWWGGQSEIRRLQRELDQQQELARALRHQLDVAQMQAEVDDGSENQTLFHPRYLTARVLGQEVVSLWQERQFLAPGASQDLKESLLVVSDGLSTLDLGSDHHLERGQLVLAQRVVLGRLTAVGQWTSTLQPVTDAKYRGEAQLMRDTAAGLQAGEVGILSGTGTGCRLQLSREIPVAVGDQVYTRMDDPLIPEPLLYGHVTAVQLPPGSLEWEITVEPAAAKLSPKLVQILRYELNPLRQVAN